MSMFTGSIWASHLDLAGLDRWLCHLLNSNILFTVISNGSHYDTDLNLSLAFGGYPREVCCKGMQCYSAPHCGVLSFIGIEKDQPTSVAHSFTVEKTGKSTHGESR